MILLNYLFENRFIVYLVQSIFPVRYNVFPMGRVKNPQPNEGGGHNVGRIRMLRGEGTLSSLLTPWAVSHQLKRSPAILLLTIHSENSFILFTQSCNFRLLFFFFFHSLK